MPDIDRRFLRRLRRLGVIEGTSTLVLFGIAMPLKYAAGLPLAVTIVGSIHGFLFLALVAMFVIGRKRIPIPTRLAGIGIVAAVLPFGPFVVDRWLERIEH
jgi:integral membrane protein